MTSSMLLRYKVPTETLLFKAYLSVRKLIKVSHMEKAELIM